MTRSRPTRGTLLAMALTMAGCGSSWPHRLSTTVHRTEEQGIDFSATGTTSLEITLDGTRGRATLSSRGVDVLGSDAETHERSVSYDVTVRGTREAFTMTLVPRPGSPATATPVTLACEPWTDAMQRAAGLDTPGAVEWICALPDGQPFALERAAIEHVPRPGAFLLLASSHAIEVHEDVRGQGDRTVRVRVAPGPLRESDRP